MMAACTTGMLPGATRAQQVHWLWLWLITLDVVVGAFWAAFHGDPWTPTQRTNVLHLRAREVAMVQWGRAMRKRNEGVRRRLVRSEFEQGWLLMGLGLTRSGGEGPWEKLSIDPGGS